MDFEGKKSGQIPAFGDWDNANELPITQYFESARQAGLVRFAPASASDECDAYMTAGRGSGGAFPVHDMYAAADFHKPPLRLVSVPPRKTGGWGEVNNGESNRRRRCGCPPHVKGHQQQQQQQRIKQVQVKAYDVKQQPRSRPTSQQLYYNNNNKHQKQLPKHSATADHHSIPTQNRTNVAYATPKPVDEDLYKIPPELLLQNSKRKKMLGFFSKCLAPPCKA